MSMQESRELRSKLPPLRSSRNDLAAERQRCQVCSWMGVADTLDAEKESSSHQPSSKLWGSSIINTEQWTILLQPGHMTMSR